MNKDELVEKVELVIRRAQRCKLGARATTIDVWKALGLLDGPTPDKELEA